LYWTISTCFIHLYIFYLYIHKGKLTHSCKGEEGGVLETEEIFEKFKKVRKMIDAKTENVAENVTEQATPTVITTTMILNDLERGMDRAVIQAKYNFRAMGG